LKWAALLALAAGASAAGLWQLRPTTAPSLPQPTMVAMRADAPVVNAPAQATSGNSNAIVSPPRAPETVRPRIEAAVERALPRLHDAHDLDRYLGDLESAARAQHHVTAVELEPGMRAIFALQGELGAEETIQRSREFSLRMTRLSAELDGRD